MIITICNFKGGVGKTTTCHALSTAKGISGNKVLMVDLDAQHSLSISCDVEVDEQEATLCDCFIAELESVEYEIEDVQDCIVHLQNVDILPCTTYLDDVNTFLTKNDNFIALKNILNKVKHLYDYIFIDCSPTNNALIKNALLASDSVIVPVESYFLGSEGLYNFICTLENINQEFNTQVFIDGIILTMYQNTNVCNGIREYVKNSIQKKNDNVDTIEIPKKLQQKNIRVFEDMVPRSIKVSEAGLYGKSIVEYRPNNPVAKAYVSIASKI